MDPRRLELLLQLSRLGSMRAVADVMNVTTSTVSQQIAALAQEAGTPLLEHEGRGVRLTPAGRRLADHAVHVLAALDAARADLDPEATPHGTLRVAAFATAIRQAVLPVLRRLAADHRDVRLSIHEHEPAEALELLDGDHVDLAMTYDYNLAPATFDATLAAIPLGTTPWGLGLPAGDPDGPATSLEVFARHRDHDWIVNSRNTADDEVVRTLASLAGFQPRVVHRADSLELVQDMIAEGLGVGLLPQAMATIPQVRVHRLADPEVTLRAYAVTRRGRDVWPPLALVLRLLEDVPLGDPA